MDQSTARTKITPVPLRPETLRRDRLIDRLREGVNRRLTLVVAEAGYGKTTLLADFSQRGLLRCLWYKLDPTDRDWLSFCDYLVAAGREARPDFGMNTEALLAQAASLGPPRDLVVSTLMAEFAALGDEPTALILDDFHLVDDSADVREITRRLLAEAPETVGLVLLTRRRPTLSLGRLTAQGEVVEIGTDDLRFSRQETERLFEEVYHHPLEPEVLDEIDTRTEGWAASLQLLHRSIVGRSKAEIRQFVRGLSGAEGRLYDFLAEEVLRELPVPLRDFMVRASILERIVPEYVAAILADGEVPPQAVIEGWIREAAGLGLMGKRAETSTSHRFHPLLREFLGRQLEMEVSAEAIRAMHGRVARAAEATDWLAACRHFIAAGEPKEAVRVVGASVHLALGTGQWGAAADLVGDLPEHEGDPAIAVLLVRRDLHEDRVDSARARLEAVDTTRASQATLALVSHARAALSWKTGDTQALEHAVAEVLANRDAPEQLVDVAAANQLLLSVARGASLAHATAWLRALGDRQATAGLHFFAGISYHNVTWLELASARYREAVDAGRIAIQHTQQSGVATDTGATEAAIAGALLELGDVDEALRYLRRAMTHESELFALSESAVLFVAMGEAATAARLLSTAAHRLAAAVVNPSEHGAFDYARSLIEPSETPSHQDYQELVDSASTSKVAATRAMALLQAGQPKAAEEALKGAIDLARRQGAAHWAVRLELLKAIGRGTRDALTGALDAAASTSPMAITELAHLVVPVVGVYGSGPVPDPITEAIRQWPMRWLPLLRSEVDQGLTTSSLVAAKLLDVHGELPDVPRLRAFEKTYLRGRKGIGLGRLLARRKSPTVLVRDLGRVVLEMNDRRVELTATRRKAASLLLFLVTRPGMTAPREAVLDALWPDLDPQSGGNSLNQTLYFLRRDIDPWYDEDVSFNYVRNEADLVWLDPEMVSADSAVFEARARGVLKQGGDLDTRLAVLGTYGGRFAPEFEYEEWATAWRDKVHASYLHLLETTQATLVRDRRLDEAMELAQGALAIDPEALDIERYLVWLYATAGAKAAASEQYAHYAATHRDQLGVEPPTFAEVTGASWPTADALRI